MAPPESAIKDAFHAGDNDDDDGLSISETVTALQKLSGQSVSPSTIESACNECGITTSREMTYDEFKSLIEYLEQNGNL
ncbi:hypothetical protein F5884DRAFT_811268 [Xylogone sp. PMI_703]|nr:hypothetical protein F5884DRAFT_811268 [Xylogone sp. PMI_703]